MMFKSKSFFGGVSQSENMGSVLAAASPSPAPAAGGQGLPGLVPVPPGFTVPPVSSVLQASSSETSGSDSSLPNPGSYEECHRKCKG